MKPNALSSAVWAAMERMQPYNRPHQVLPPLLGILADLDNSDKHRLLNVFMATPTEVDLTVEGVLDPGIQFIRDIRYFGAIEQRTEIHRTIFRGPAPDMRYKVNVMEVVLQFGTANGNLPMKIGKLELRPPPCSIDFSERSRLP
jgi:hypothetical protein